MSEESGHLRHGTYVSTSATASSVAPLRKAALALKSAKGAFRVARVAGSAVPARPAMAVSVGHMDSLPGSYEKAAVDTPRRSPSDKVWVSHEFLSVPVTGPRYGRR